MKILTIKKNGQTASLRTRNRINDNGPDFESIENPNRPGSILLKSLKTNWLGWLPENEIIISKQQEVL
jgi:hypothetical protein